jgi:hypothetical protein
MGKLLLISLGWTLVATLLFLPAILAQFGTSQASRLGPQYQKA